MDPVQQLLNLCTAYINQDPAQINEVNAKLNELIQEESTVYNIAAALQNQIDPRVKALLSVLLGRTFTSQTFDYKSIATNLQTLLFNMIIEDPDFQIKKNIAHAACVLYGNLHEMKEKVIWYDFITFSLSLLQNEQTLAVGFFIWYQYKFVTTDVNMEINKTAIFDLAAQSLSNPNQIIRIQAATYIENTIGQDCCDEYDMTQLCNTLNQAAKFAIYEADGEKEQEVQAITKAISELVQVDKLENYHCICLDYMWEVMHYQDLPIWIRLYLADIINDGTVSFLSGKNTDEYLGYLEFAVEFTALLTRETDLILKKFDYLHYFLWAIAESSHEDFPLNYVINYVDGLKQDLTIPNRILALFLIDSVAIGSREYIYKLLNVIIADINELGDIDDDFVIQYTCTVYTNLIDAFPEEMGYLVDQIALYLLKYFPREGTSQTIIHLFNTVIPRPKNLAEIISNFNEMLGTIDNAQDMTVALNILSACYSYPTAPNEEIFGLYAGNLIGYVQETELLIPPVFEFFSKLVYVSPATTGQEIESIVNLCVEALVTENPEYMASALQLLDAVLDYIPISLSPYIEKILPMLDLLRENNQINDQKSEDDEDDVTKKLLPHLLHVYGRLVAAFPAEMASQAEIVAQWFKKILESVRKYIIPLLEASIYAVEGFRYLAENISFNIVTEFGQNITRALNVLNDRAAFVYLNKLADQLVTVFPEELNSEAGLMFAQKLCIGFGGEIFDYMQFELSQLPDYPIVVSLSNVYKKLIYAQYMNDNVVTQQMEKLSALCKGQSWMNFHILELYSLFMLLRGDLSVFDDPNAIVSIEASLNLSPNSSPIKLKLLLSYFTNLLRLSPEKFAESGIIDPNTLITFSVYFIREIPLPADVNIVRLAFFATVLQVQGYDVIPADQWNIILKGGFIQSLLPLPVDSFDCEIIIPFLHVMEQRYPDEFTNLFNQSAINMMCSLPFFYQRVPTELIIMAVQRIQQFPQDTILAMLKGNQYLLIRLNRNIELLNETIAQSGGQ